MACIIGDGEAETAPTAGAWHGNKFLNPATDGAVLPILHLNGFKISSPTISASMSEEELRELHSGLGYAVRFVRDGDRLDEDLDSALEWAHEEIRVLQTRARSGERLERPRWPIIILVTPKGLGGPREIDGHRVEGSFRSHQVPIAAPRTNPVHLAALERWLRSYRPEELFDSEGRPAVDLLSMCPPRDRRIAMNPAGFGLDPYGLHLAWEPIQAAGELRTIDLFLNFPVADINRNVLWRDPDRVDPADIARMTRFGGDDSWRPSRPRPSTAASASTRRRGDSSATGSGSSSGAAGGST